MGSEEKEDGLYRITTSQQAICSCCGALITSVLVTPLDVVKVRLQVQMNPSLKGKSFLDSDGVTDHVYLYENGSGKTWHRTSGRLNGMMHSTGVTMNSSRRYCVRNQEYMNQLSLSPSHQEQQLALLLPH